MCFSGSDSKGAPLYLAALLIWCMVTVGNCGAANSSIMVEYSSSSAAAEDGYIYGACNVVKYSNGTQFDGNVKVLFKILSNTVPYTGFTAFIYGRNPNRVSGRLQCRGDLSPGDCRACADEAVNSIRRVCPNAVGAGVQMEHCYLRYENYPFLSQLDTSFSYGLVNTKSNADSFFNESVGGLMADLSEKAPASRIKFAMGSTGVPHTNLVLYGMEMCWRDVSKADCATCLSKGIQQMFSCCKKRVGVQVFMGSCTLRYEIYPFAKQY